MAQMLIPRVDGSKAIVAGRVAHLMVGDKRVKFFIHEGTLSHYASGHRFGQLDAIKLEYMCRRGHNARLPDRAAAQGLIDRTIDRLGSAEKVLGIMNAAPLLNT